MVSFRFAVTSAAVVLLAAPFAVEAQSLPAPGTRVRAYARVTGTDGAAGTVESVDSDTLRLRTAERPSRTFVIPKDSLWRLETSLGKGTRIPGMSIGAATGAIFAGASTMLVVREVQSNHPDCEKCVFGPTPEEAKRWADEDVKLKHRATMIGAVVGGVAGAWIGSYFRKEHWRRVPVGNTFGIRPDMSGRIHVAIKTGVPRLVNR